MPNKHLQESFQAFRTEIWTLYQEQGFFEGLQVYVFADENPRSGKSQNLCVA